MHNDDIEYRFIFADGYITISPNCNENQKQTRIQVLHTRSEHCECLDITSTWKRKSEETQQGEVITPAGPWERILKKDAVV